MMTKKQVGEILTMASVIDGFVVTVEMVNLWHMVIGKYEAEAVHAALIAHLGESSYPVKPADIVQQMKVATIRRREVHGIHPKAPEGKRWAVDVMDSMKELGA